MPIASTVTKKETRTTVGVFPDGATLQELYLFCEKALKSGVPDEAKPVINRKDELNFLSIPAMITRLVVQVESEAS